MNSIKWYSLATVFLMPCMVRGIAEEPRHLIHRWELEPELHTDWGIPPPVLSNSLEPERFLSHLQQTLVAESRTALEQAARVDPAVREQAIINILQQLRKPQENRYVHLRLASAAIALDDGTHAEELWMALGIEDATRPLVERALVDWKSSAAAETWRNRLRQPEPKLAEVLIALEGLGAAGDIQDQPLLEAWLRSDRLPTAGKVVAARALGTIATSELEPLASELRSADVEHAELLAAELLSQHRSPAAQTQLRALLDSQNQPARQSAYVSLAAHFPETAREAAEAMLEEPDNNLRQQAVLVLNRFDDVASLRLQAQRIGDLNQTIRVTVRNNLRKKADIPALLPVINEVLTRQFESGSHQGIEQAIVLSVELRQAERCPQYLRVLEHPHLETSQVAAWALQELAESPEVLDGIYEHTQRVTERLQTTTSVTFVEQLRQAFLFEALGRNRYQPALPMLKKYIKKDSRMGNIARASAIWAIGKIMLGSQDELIANKLAERMRDNNVDNPEYELVRYCSAIALGWLRAPSSKASLESLQIDFFQLGLARQWSLEQLEQP